jgi:Eco29kI restriction endonuclease
MSLFPNEQAPSVPFDEQRLLAALKALIEALPTATDDLSTLPTARRRKLLERIDQAVAGLQKILPPPLPMLDALKVLLEVIPEELVDPKKVGSLRKELASAIEQAITRLQRVKTELDPVKLPAYVLDPSHPAVVGKLIANTLLVQPRHALATLPRFYGSGVYAIYYSGDFDAYQPLKGSETPIYIGKADPATSEAITPIEQGQKLWGRLVQDHKRNIEAATSTLSINDFSCRYLVVKSAWQGTAETYLIGRFKPIWNNESKICYGFGKHGDSAETRANTRSPWDTLHPGRRWATTETNVPYKLTPEQIKEQIAEHFKRYPPET